MSGNIASVSLSVSITAVSVNHSLRIRRRHTSSHHHHHHLFNEQFSYVINAAVKSQLLSVDEATQQTAMNGSQLIKTRKHLINHVTRQTDVRQQTTDEHLATATSVVVVVVVVVAAVAVAVVVVVVVIAAQVDITGVNISYLSIM